MLAGQQDSIQQRAMSKPYLLMPCPVCETVETDLLTINFRVRSVVRITLHVATSEL